MGRNRSAYRFAETRYVKVCGSKEPHATEEAAQEAAAGINLSHRGNVTPYKCGFCPHWHVGTQLPGIEYNGFGQVFKGKRKQYNPAR